MGRFVGKNISNQIISDRVRLSLKAILDKNKIHIIVFSFYDSII